MEKYMLPCLSKLFFGVECPGCGIQRATVMLVEGDFYKAWQMYPALFTLIPFFLVLFASFVDRQRNYAKAIIGLSILNLVVLLAAFAYKMILR